jgi:hypothetical protein
MSDGDGVTPWALIAHKQGYWLAVADPKLRDIGREVAGWLKHGCTITTVHSRAEYNAVMLTLKIWPKGGPSAPQPKRATALGDLLNTDESRRLSGDAA